MLGLGSYAYDDPYVAGLTSLICFALMLMLSCEPGFNQHCYTNSEQIQQAIVCIV